MHRAILSLIGLGLFLAHPFAQSEGLVVFEHVSVIPMDRERVMSDQTVVVRNDLITQVGQSDRVAVPDGGTRIDGRGRFLIPALGDMHAHIPGGTFGTQLTGDASDRSIARVLFLYLANGVGTIRNTLGHPSHLELRGRAQRGEILSPTIYTPGPPLNGLTAPTRDAAEEMVRAQEAAGYDFVKVFTGVSLDVFDATAATADELGIRLAGHVPYPGAEGFHRALRAKVWTIDHLDGYLEALAPSLPPQPDGFTSAGPAPQLMPYVDDSLIPAVVEETKAAGTWVVPTLIVNDNIINLEEPEAMAKRPEIQYAAPQQVAKWITYKRTTMDRHPPEMRTEYMAFRRRLVKALHSAGVGIVSGSDSPQNWNVPGYSLHRELAAFVESGLTPYQALETSTHNIAAHFDTLDTGGTVEVGKRADLVLLDASPLQDIMNTSAIAGVMIGGRWLPKSEIDRRLAELRATIP